MGYVCVQNLRELKVQYFTHIRCITIETQQKKALRMSFSFPKQPPKRMF